MFTWLTKLFGFEKEIGKAANEAVKEVLADEPPKAHVGKVVDVQSPIAQAKQPAKPKKQAKKPAAIKAAKVDLDSMKKNELLAHAKANGVKANASMNKAEILAAIKG